MMMDVIIAHVTSGGSSIATHFKLNADGGVTRGGDAETSDAEADAAAPTVLDRGQRKKIGAKRYEAAIWEGH
jgi:hypothetical protein